MNDLELRDTVLSGTVLSREVAVAEGVQEVNNPFHVYISGLAKGDSRRAMAACLERLAAIASSDPDDPFTAATFPWGALRPQNAAALRALIEEQTRVPRGRPQQPWSTSYRNKHLAALRGVLKSSWTLGLLPGDDYQRAKALLEDFRGSRLPAGRAVALDELEKLLNVCLADDSICGRRDAALIGILYITGVRRAEAAALKISDWDPKERKFRIVGKGNKERLVGQNQFGTDLLNAWLWVYEAAAEKGVFHRNAALFPPITKDGKIQSRNFTPPVIGKIVDKRRGQAGTAPLTPHDFRHNVIGEMLDNGVDVVTVALVAGHADINTTRSYDRRGGRNIVSAADSLPMPTVNLGDDTPALEQAETT